MKKVLMTMVVVAAVMACTSSPYGQGGDNACQFVKEQAPGLRDDIAKVEVVGEDSMVVYDVPMLMEELKSKEADADLNIITCKELREFAESISKQQEVRVVYWVAVIKKSSKQEVIGVIMEADGTTPYMLRDEYIQMEKPFNESRLADEVMVCESDLEDK